MSASPSSCRSPTYKSRRHPQRLGSPRPAPPPSRQPPNLLFFPLERRRSSPAPWPASSIAPPCRRRSRIPDRVRSRACRPRAPSRCLRGSTQHVDLAAQDSSRRRRGFRSACACERSISACSRRGAIARDDLRRHHVLQLEDVLQFAVHAVGPESGAGLGVDQLPGDAQPVAGLAHASFKHVADAELAADLLHVDRAALVGEAGIAGDHEQPVHARQGGDDLVDDPVDEIVLLRIVAEVDEGQHGDRGLAVAGRRRHQCRPLTGWSRAASKACRVASSGRVPSSCFSRSARCW